LKALASAVGIASQVRFLGFQEPAPYLEAADVLVLATCGEGISNALLEAKPTATRLGMAARARIEDHYTLDEMLKRYEALYERLAHRAAQ
jgi:glycosyltransferase involved in cell wall biosynthesis